jgi:hypothetical protein
MSVLFADSVDLFAKKLKRSSKLSSERITRGLRAVGGLLKDFSSATIYLLYGLFAVSIMNFMECHNGIINKYVYLCQEKNNYE